MKDKQLIGYAIIGLPYSFGLLFGVLTAMGFWDNSSDMDGVYQLAALYNQDRDVANPLTGSAPPLPEEGDGYNWFTTLPKLNVKENTYRDALAYALMLQKQKGNKYKEMQLDNTTGDYKEAFADNPEGLARKYAGDIDDMTRTLSGLWAAKGNDYRDSKVYKSLSKDEKMLAVIHGIQFWKKAVPNWDARSIGEKNVLMKSYLDHYNPKIQMSNVEEDIYKNGNFEKYRKYFGNSGFAQDKEISGRIKDSIAQAKATEEAKKAQQLAMEKAKKESEERRLMNIQKQEERRRRVLDRQGR